MGVTPAVVGAVAEESDADGSSESSNTGSSQVDEDDRISVDVDCRLAESSAELACFSGQVPKHAAGQPD